MTHGNKYECETKKKNQIYQSVAGETSIFREKNEKVIVKSEGEKWWLSNWTELMMM